MHLCVLWGQKGNTQTFFLCLYVPVSHPCSQNIFIINKKNGQFGWQLGFDDLQSQPVDRILFSVILNWGIKCIRISLLSEKVPFDVKLF